MPRPHRKLPGRRLLPALLVASCLATIAVAKAAGAAPAPAALEALRANADLAGQLAHARQAFATIAAAMSDDARVLPGWREQSTLFGVASQGGMATGRAAASHQSVGAPLLLMTHYNPAAARHIEVQRLNQRATLEHLRATAPADSRIPAMRSIPEFPVDAMVVKTCWWPVAARGLTPMPYWDPRREAPRRGGNPYTSWRSVVAIEPPGRIGVAARTDVADVHFAGRSFARAPRVPLDAFRHLRVDALLAQRLMADAESRRAAVVALGRPLAAGDYLALVATHVATRELPEWIWITSWWDGARQQAATAPESKVAARASRDPRDARAAAAAPPWLHYALDSSFDAETPRERDGGARITFNPWLEARMPDEGSGDGTHSNCLACHRRASYPGTRFLPVTRGAPDLARDPAFEPGKLRTGFLWSIATRAH